MQPVKRRIGFDDVDEANEEIAALLAVLADLHTRLNAADVPPDGTLSERVQALLKRLRRLEADADVRRTALIELARERDEARQAGLAARRWKAAAKAFRRRWRDACAEMEGEARS